MRSIRSPAEGRALTADVRRLTVDEVLATLPGFRRRAVGGGGVYEPGAMAIDTALLLQSFLAGRGGGGRA